jgi:hypothetical protein
MQKFVCAAGAANGLSFFVCLFACLQNDGRRLDAPPTLFFPGVSNSLLLLNNF